jgi:hypothetical protein
MGASKDKLGQGFGEMRDLSGDSHLLQQQIGVEQIDYPLFCVAAVQEL